MSGRADWTDLWYSTSTCAYNETYNGGINSRVRLAAHEEEKRLCTVYR